MQKKWLEGDATTGPRQQARGTSYLHDCIGVGGEAHGVTVSCRCLSRRRGYRRCGALIVQQEARVWELALLQLEALGEALEAGSSWLLQNQPDRRSASAAPAAAARAAASE
jgi:hypothetical protein